MPSPAAVATLLRIANRKLPRSDELKIDDKKPGEVKPQPLPDDKKSETKPDDKKPADAKPEVKK